jgi:hypothetical protein
MQGQDHRRESHRPSKSPPSLSRALIDPRGVLAEFGVILPGTGRPLAPGARRG